MNVNINQQVFIMIKPDAIERKLTGRIISMFEDGGLTIEKIQIINATETQASNHYPSTEEWLTSVGNKSLTFYKENNLNPADFFDKTDAKSIGEEVKKRLVQYMVNGKMIAILATGCDAITQARKIAGATIPTNAEMGSIRGTFSADNPLSSAMEKRCIHNLVHVSDSEDAVKEESAIWFN